MHWVPGDSYPYTAAQLTHAINSYSTTFDGTANNWPGQGALGNVETEVLVTADVFARGLALKQNKLPAAFLEIANLNGTTNSPFSLRAVITSDDYATDVTNSALGILTVNDVAELAATNVMGSLFNANEDYFDDHNISNRYGDLDKMVPTVAAVGEALHELQTDLGWTAMPWTSDEIASAAAYDTTFVGDTGATANAWPAADKTKLVNGETFAKALATKQNKITPSVDEEFIGSGEYGIGMVTANNGGTAITGQNFYVARNDMMGLSDLASDTTSMIAPLVNANYDFFTNNNLSQYYNSLDKFVPTVAAVGEALAVKQNKIATTSDGTNSTPNYVYNATTNPTADGSVVTTTTTAGIVDQRGIATAPTYDNSNNLTNGSWIPTMSALMNQVAGATAALSWDSTFPAAIDSYSTTFDSSSTHTAGNWPYQGEAKLVNGTTFANSLARKQNILPAKLASGDTAPSGGMTIDLTTSPGVVGTRYITRGGTIALTQKTGALPVIDYVTGINSNTQGSVSLSGYATSVGLTQAQVRDSLVSLELLKDVYDWLALEIESSVPTGPSGEVATYLPGTNNTGAVGGHVAIYSGPTAQNPYNATNDANKLATAGFVETKQDTISAAMITFQDLFGDTFTLPAFTTYDTTNGLVANNFGVLDYATMDTHNYDLWMFTDEWAEEQEIGLWPDKIFPTVRVVANAIDQLQYKLPALHTSTTLPLGMKSKGGETIGLASNAGLVEYRYIASSIDEALTDKSTGTTPDDIWLYINGTKTLAQFEASNFGGTNTTQINKGKAYIKGALVNLETLKGFYSKIQTEIANADLSSHKVNGAPLSNPNSYFYGEGVGAADEQTKTVTIDSITGTLNVGQFIIVKPATTNTASSIKINLNNTTAYSVLYRGSTSNIPQEVWTAYTPSVFVLDQTSGGTKYWRYVGTLPEAMTWGSNEISATNAYSTTFGSATGNWPTDDANKYVKGDSFAQGLALKQKVFPVMAQNAPVTIPTYPEYGDNPGEIGQMYLDTSTLYTTDDTHFPSSKLLNTTLSLYVPKADAYNTTNLNSDLSTNYTGAPSWATSNGVSSLYRIPGQASGTNWAATALSTWSSDKIVPTMDTLARSLAGLYSAVGDSIAAHMEDYERTTAHITTAEVTIPNQIAYTGNRFLNDGNQLFWLPGLADAGDENAIILLKKYAEEKIAPTMDELAYALDGVLQTNETTTEWQDVARFNGVRVTSLFELKKYIEGGEREAVAFNDTGYLQTFAPTLEALMDESYELEQLIERKQDKLSGTNGTLVTYTGTAGYLGATTIATSITNTATTVPNTQAVYNAVNARQNIIPVAGKYRASNTATSDTTISDWTDTNIKGTALVTKPTSTNGVVGERKIFEKGATYTNDAATNIQIATIGAVMENTVTKTCAEYRPGTSGETAENCWLWTITGNAGAEVCQNPDSCRGDSDCCDGFSCNNRACVRQVPLVDFCRSAGQSCGVISCCDGLTCTNGTCTSSRSP
jgi:hypothetical protein